MATLVMAHCVRQGSALLAAVEHRFYGASQPTGDYSDLSTLSVDQVALCTHMLVYLIAPFFFCFFSFVLPLLLFRAWPTML